MCGTVGLFLGCPAVSFCPKKILIAGSTAGVDRDMDWSRTTEPVEYKSPFRNWHERASVRQAPRRLLQDPEPGQHFFSPELVPLAQHPVITELRPELFDEVLVRQLLRYLHFTAVLENLVVNRTILGIAHGSIAVDIPDEMRMDAFKLYCDEAYHALFSADMTRQIEEATGIRSNEAREPYFLVRLRELLAEAPENLAPLIEILFVVVSETLISAQLSEIPSSAQLVPAIQEVIQDHARDEGRHHAYFVAYLRYLWGALDSRQRRAAALFVPRLIRIFVDPDACSIQQELTGYGISRDGSRQILDEIFPEKLVSEHARLTARQTIRYFVDLGIMEDEQVREEFMKHGLLEAS